MWLESYGYDTRRVSSMKKEKRVKPPRPKWEPKNEIALLSPEDVSSAISESYKPPKRFVRWQPDFVKPSCQFVSRKAIGGRCFPVSTRSASVNLATLAGHKICFHKSHVPCGSWCQ